MSYVAYWHEYVAIVHSHIVCTSCLLFAYITCTCAIVMFGDCVTAVSVCHVTGCGCAAGEYSTSLDKLNSSLSELQGEIMSMSLSSSNDGSRHHSPAAAAPPAQRGSAPRMTQSDDVLAQGIKDNFYLIPREGEAGGTGGGGGGTAGRRSMTPQRMTQSVPGAGAETNRSANNRIAQFDDSDNATYEQRDYQQQQHYPQTQRHRATVSPPPPPQLQQHTYSSPQRFESPPLAPQAPHQLDSAPSYHGQNGQFGSPQYILAEQQQQQQLQQQQHYGIMPPSNTQMYAQLPAAAAPTYGQIPPQHQQGAQYTLHGQPVHQPLPPAHPPHMPVAQWGVPIAPPPNAPSPPVQYGQPVGAATSNIPPPQQQRAPVMAPAVGAPPAMTSQYDTGSGAHYAQAPLQHDTHHHHQYSPALLPPNSTAPVSAAAAVPGHEPGRYDQFTFNNNNVSSQAGFSSATSGGNDVQSPMRQQFYSGSAERLHTQPQHQQLHSPSVLQQFAVSQAPPDVPIDRNIMTTSVSSSRGVRSPSSHATNNDAYGANDVTAGVSNTHAQSPRTPTRATQVTNDGFFIAFDNDTPVKPRPKLGQRPRLNSGSGNKSSPKSSAHAALPPKSTISPARDTSAPVSGSGMTSDAQNYGSESSPAAQASSSPQQTYEPPAAPGEAFVITTDDLGDSVSDASFAAAQCVLVVQFTCTHRKISMCH